MPVDFTLKESGSLHSFYTNKDYSLFGVIGNPISHSKSPELHNHWLRLSGLSNKAEYIKINITKSHDLKEIILTMPKMGFVGCNITVPFKEEVFNIISELEEQGLAEFKTSEDTSQNNFLNAKAIGAVNCLFFNPETNKIEAYNTDVTGFIKALISLTSSKNKQNDDEDFYIKSNLRKKLSLGLNFKDFQIYKQKLDEPCLISKEEFKMFIKENSGIHLQNLVIKHSINALLIGAGGSARAVLCASGLFNSVTIANRSMQNALNLCGEFACLKSVKVKAIELSAVNPQDYNLIINATPLGLKAGEYPSIKYEMIDPSTFCYDLIYPKDSPQSLTPFLLKCKEAGAHESRLINGYGMLIGQAAESYKIWTGHKIIY
jgi:shikimate 5-dehydrogenase